jgi:hypothetical protein
VKFIREGLFIFYFVLVFVAIKKWDYFLISSSDNSLLAYKKATDLFTDFVSHNFAEPIY